jgi:hypothetical protein
MIGPFTALDFATKHRSVADQILENCDGDDLCELAVGLMGMYWNMAQRVLSPLGQVLAYHVLTEIREYDLDWDCRRAAALILAHAQMADNPGIEADLRAFGADAMDEKLHLADLFDNMTGTVSAIPRVWRLVLPDLDTPGAQSLLEHLVTQEIE